MSKNIFKGKQNSDKKTLDLISETKNNIDNIANQTKHSVQKIIKENEIKDIEIDEYKARKVFKEILNKAILKNASDIHIEPFNNYILVRMRIDGILNEELKLDVDIYNYLVSVIKLDTSMDITEKRLPQDGRIDISIKNRIIDVRVSTIPTVNGEKLVLRILNRDAILKTKQELGFSKDALEKIQRIINKNSGILLVTGSTGSGKTTTVYSILNDLKDKSKNITTIEDPIEYRIDGINQMHINSKIGLSFDIGLKSILRQDPDVIMVGEIRDTETANTAIKAATTGHLVISTLHTKDSISSIYRLIDMDIDPYLINSSLIGVISQRLIRKVCQNCAKEIKEDNKITKIAKGCDKCFYTGYSGRIAIYEILEINEYIKNCIYNQSYENIKHKAIENGMITFQESGRYLLENKITTLDEYKSVVNVD